MRAIYRKRLRALGEFVAVGVVVGALVGELIHQMDGGAVGPYVVRGVAVGVLIGCLLRVGEELLFVGIGRGLSYAGLNTSRILLYTAGIIASLVGVNSAYPWLIEGTTLAEGARLYALSDTMGSGRRRRSWPSTETR